MGQETTRKRASLSFMSFLKKLRVPPTPGFKRPPCILPCLSGKHGSVLRDPPTFPSAAPISAEANTGLLKELVPKNLKMKLTEQWEQPKGRA